ncbi:DUF1501 domain-containing protein [Sulfidibacter corallicola]|uniref:DUF1501 domain-containing protein n=1 Tax=Sulfidibacter corallicola TaxID=2818388 RepID=A0A8A4TQQ3_SULCO|nr:DUF1501 domain-containing protein [Sulfidibacter corallicola]QTD51271.1 DUF1501 domain-containing protein [Sulfidibacter corallicola]
MSIKRRTFLKALAGGMTLGSQALAARSAKPRLRGKGGVVKKLVVVFQRGGNDALNTLVPVDATQYNLYRNLRPTLGFTTNQLSPVPNNSFFRMHPALNPMSGLISGGDLSMIHAVGYPDSDRSHFESQAYYETAIPGNSLSSGWLNRFLQNSTSPLNPEPPIRGIHIGSNIPQAASGQVSVPVSNNFGRLRLEVDGALDDTREAALREEIRNIYNLDITGSNDRVYGTGRKIFQMLDNFADRDLDDYVPENGAVYPDSRLGERVAHAAQMLKDDNPLGIEVVTIDQGGYDTHAGQVNPNNLTSLDTPHMELLDELSRSMVAFYQDMGATRMDDILFLVVTEFGRRAYQNDSNGTDHGTGALAMVMGGPTNGQMINGGGNWPSLASLYRGHDLGWVTDFRDIYWEILRNHMGMNDNDLQAVIPGHTYSPVGFIP